LIWLLVERGKTLIPEMRRLEGKRNLEGNDLVEIITPQGWWIEPTVLKDWKQHLQEHLQVMHATYLSGVRRWNAGGPGIQSGESKHERRKAKRKYWTTFLKDEINHQRDLRVQRKRIYSLCNLDKKISLGLNWVEFYSSANYLWVFKSEHVKHPLTFAISPIQSITHLNIERPISKLPDFL
jgi:hypothetical protein